MSLRQEVLALASIERMCRFDMVRDVLELGTDQKWLQDNEAAIAQIRAERLAEEE